MKMRNRLMRAFAILMRWLRGMCFERRPALRVSFRREPSDFDFGPMISPTLCPISFTALKWKFFSLHKQATTAPKIRAAI